MRRLLAAVLTILTIVAQIQPAGAFYPYPSLFGTSGPAYQANFLSMTSTADLTAAGISVSSPSLGGLVTDSSGKLTYKPNNLLTYSNTFSNAAWTTQQSTTAPSIVATGLPDPNGGNSATAVTYAAINSASDYSLTRQLFSSFSPGNYIAAIWVRAHTGADVGKTISLSAYQGSLASATNVVLTSSWQQISFKGSNSVSGFEFDVGSLGSGLHGSVSSQAAFTADIYAATLSAVTYETSPRPADQVITTASAYYGPAFDHDSAGNPLGLRVWEQRQNVLTYSNLFSNAAWTKSGVVETDAQATSPDGTTNAASFAFNAGVSGSITAIYQKYTGTITAGSAWTGSIWLRASSACQINLALNGATSTANNVGTTVNVTTAWQKFTYTLSNPASDTGLFWIVATSIPSTTGTSVLPACTVYAYQADLVNASFAGPPIPTGSAAVTAAPDVVTLSGPPLALLQGSAGTLIVEGSIGGNSANYALFVTANGSSAVYPIGAQLNNDVISNNGTTRFSSPFYPTYANTNRYGISWNASGRTMAATGYSSASGDTNPFATSAITSVRLGSGGDGNYFINGYLRKMPIWSSKLPDATLVSKVVLGAPF